MSIVSSLLLAAAVASESAVLTRDTRFTEDRVWTVHLTFSADQWKAMEPEQPGPSPFGGPGREPNPEDFGLGMFLAEPWLKGLNGNQDGGVIQAEFKGGFVRWHETWDADKNGRLSEEEMRRGMNREWSPFRGGLPEAPAAANRP